jgi:large subunit ribosomal protein L16
VAHRGNTVAHGDFALQSLDEGWLTARQIEAGRMAATHFLHREGHVYIRVFPHKPVSAKPLETRMGKGKGEPEYYVAVVKKGTIIYEIGGVQEDIARQALMRVSHKMPFRCRFVSRRHAV